MNAEYIFQRAADLGAVKFKTSNVFSKILRRYKHIIMVTASISCLFGCNETVSEKQIYVDEDEGRYSIIMFNQKGDTAGIFQCNKDSVLDGTLKYYYENGSLKSTFMFKNGLLNGKEVRYYPDGDTEYEGMYDEGKKDSVWRYYWNETNNLRAQFYYYDGSKFGNNVEFDKEGNIDTCYFYNLDGLLGKIIPIKDSFEVHGVLIITYHTPTNLNLKDTFKIDIFVATLPNWNLEFDSKIVSVEKVKSMEYKETDLFMTQVYHLRHTSGPVGEYKLFNEISIRASGNTIYPDTLRYTLNYNHTY